MREIKYFIIHCSASEWGDVDIIREWHLERGFNDIGYHFVILNGFRTYESYVDSKRVKEENGLLEKGRDVVKVGAHVLNMNSNSIGICLIGNKTFTSNQYRTLFQLLKKLKTQFNIPVQNILGHYECPTGKAQGKTCPNIYMNGLRKLFQIYYGLGN